jgi:hypothetical protein
MLIPGMKIVLYLIEISEEELNLEGNKNLQFSKRPAWMLFGHRYSSGPGFD